MRLKRAGSGWRFYCIKCKEFHVVDHRWKATNENTDKPSLDQSVRTAKCHLTIKDGVITYLEDV